MMMMMMIDKRIVVFLSILFAVSDVFSDLVNPLPQNNAVLKGSMNVMFSCSSTFGFNFVGWSVAPVGESNRKTIASGIAVVATYRDAFQVSQSGAATSILTIIKAVDESLAGTYFCAEAGGLTFNSSQLIVYNSDPVCTSNVSSVNYLNQGQSVQMSCSFSYTGNVSSADISMVWSKGSAASSPVGSPPPVVTTTGILTTAVSTINQVVGYSSPFPVYQCRTSFGAVTGATATNVPAYNNTTMPFNSAINVWYFNPNCSITGANSGDSVYFGTSISCQADSNPAPSYRWSNDTNATLSSTSTVQILNDGQYTCSAWNNINSCALSVNLTARSPPAADVEGGGLSEKDKKTVIGVVVGVGSGIILFLLIIIICCCMRRKSRAERFKEDRNVKPMVDYPPPYDGHVGPQRNSNPDVVDHPSADYPYPIRSSPANPYIVDDGLNYAQIQLDNQPRSRQPLQMPENSNYVDVALA